MTNTSLDILDQFLLCELSDQPDESEKGTHYQILVVEPDDDKSPGRTQNIKTKILVYPEREFQSTQYKAQLIKEPEDLTLPAPVTIGQTLPTKGVMLSQGFLKALFPKGITDPEGHINDQTINRINNFYEVVRRLLASRKMSQLIAKTWYSYIIAKQTQNGSSSELWWRTFAEGRWSQFTENRTIENTPAIDILNGLIAREIFLSDFRRKTHTLEGKTDVYREISVEQTKKEYRFLILPSSRAWRHVALSLLLAGQAYSKINGVYYQIAPSILSTGEMVIKYGIEDVVFDTFSGTLREIPIVSGEYTTAFPIVIPYPPIPDQNTLSTDDIKRWAYARDEDDKEDFPFYRKCNNQYSVAHYTPPFPYIPLSCCC